MEEILFTRIREVKNPVRAHSTDGGIDFFVPDFNEKFFEAFKKANQNYTKVMEITQGGKSIALYPGGRMLIPSGIKVKFRDASILQANNKSGISTSKGVLFTAQVVDSQYTGEVHIGIYNSNPHTTLYIEPGMKLIQFVHVPVLLSKLIEISPEEYTLITEGSERGDKGFGSTNKTDGDGC